MDQPRPPLARYLLALRMALRDDLAIYAVTALYIALGYLYLSSKGYLAFGSLNAYFAAWSVNFGALGPLFIGIIGVSHIILRLNKRRRLAFRAMFAPGRLARFVAGTILLLTALLLFTAMFSAIKTSFPIDHGFRFDVVQADIDKAIHFGVDPFHLLYAVGGNRVVLAVVEANYNVLWFIIGYSILYWMATSPRANTIRVRYILTWMACWIVIGNLMAGTWLSAGPAFYGQVTGDTGRFADLLALLSTTAGQANSAHNFQNYLWSIYASGRSGIGSGISAFPSMHVAIVVLNALFISERSRRFGALLWVYVAIIIASSVFLGWHYAIDGYVSVICVTALYWALRLGLPALSRLSPSRALLHPVATVTRNPQN